MHRYYVLGSNWYDGRWHTVLDKMVEEKAVAVGYGRHISLARLYGKPEQQIVDALEAAGECPASCHAHKRFLNLRPGDRIAIKKFASPAGKTPRLIIHAYAVVTKRGGVVYRRGRGELAHLINATFVESHRERLIELGGYSHTIHELRDRAKIRAIFPAYLRKASVPTAPKSNGTAPGRRASVIGKVEQEWRVTQAKRIPVSAEHKRLQRRLCRYLEKIYGKRRVFCEQDHVDVQADEGRCWTLYEIKPHKSALLCIRDALGQLMLYGCNAAKGRKKKLRLVIVGPNPLTREERPFFDFVKERFGIEYMVCPA